MVAWSITAIRLYRSFMLVRCIRCVAAKTKLKKPLSRREELLMTTLRGFLAALWVIVSCISAHDEPLQTSHQRRQGRPLRRTISHFGENGKTTMEVDGHMTWEPIISLSNELHARSRIRVSYSAQATVAVDGIRRG